LGAFLALRAKNRAIRSKSSEAPMRFLWAFRYYPGCMGEQQNCVCNFVTSPWRTQGLSGTEKANRKNHTAINCV
jgi:hypothetical protein